MNEEQILELAKQLYIAELINSKVLIEHDNPDSIEECTQLANHAITAVNIFAKTYSKYLRVKEK